MTADRAVARRPNPAGALTAASRALGTWVRIAASAYALAAVPLVLILLIAGARPSLLGWSGLVAALAAGALSVLGSLRWEGGRAWAMRTMGFVLAVYGLYPLADIGILFLPLTIALLPALVPSRLAPRSETRS